MEPRVHNYASIVNGELVPICAEPEAEASNTQPLVVVNTKVALSPASVSEKEVKPVLVDGVNLGIPPPSTSKTK